MQDRNKNNAEVFSRIADKYAATFDGDEFDNNFVDFFMGPVKAGSKVLDLGCGTGALTKRIADKGMEVEGIDLAEGMLEIARNKYPDIKFSLGDIRDIDFPGRTFDVVWAGYILFYLEKGDFMNLLNKIRKILKPGGIFVLVMQEGEGDVEVEEFLTNKEKVSLTLYRQDEIVDLLEKKGFSIKHKSIREREPEEELPYRKLLFVAEVVR